MLNEESGGLFMRRVVHFTATTALFTLALTHAASAQIQPSPESLEGLYAGRPYSPYAQRTFPTQVYWGDTHLHTAMSADAGLFGNRLGLDEAYRFARGEEVISSTGQPARLGRPLDWLAVTDHSDAMGFATDLFKGAPAIVDTEQGSRWFTAMQEGGDAAAAAALDLITTFAQGNLDPALVAAYYPGSPAYDAVWKSTIETAERFYEPGRFTTFIGFEWTSLVAGNNLHRNVILRDGGDLARQVQPMVTQGPLGSTDPLDLYAWLEAYEAKTGGDALAIAHNGNLSNGMMFPYEVQHTGAPVDETYAALRGKWEPLYEVTQIKGTGETHPLLSPDDEFAGFEIWDAGNLDLSEAKTPEMLPREYAREALKQGLALEARLGTNPYKFGLVGSTDSHTSLSSAEEENFFGKAASGEPSSTRVEHPFTRTAIGEFPGWSLSASGYTGVWATANTREAIWDAMARREVYGTSGPRMTVRFFGGWDFTAADLTSRQPAAAGYARGVPMGGDLRPATSAAPTFMVYALRDPVGANLDRIQIVKGWQDTDGTLQEKVYDVAWSDGRAPGPDGKVPLVGNTVDVETASFVNTIGASELGTVWTDPDFDPAERAVYYARVIEIPTPRWILYDRVRLGAEIPEDATLTLQERAYTSPIWYTP
jgi:hypothetical protein